jgi:hypothetical protein
VHQNAKVWWKFLGEAALLDVRQKKEQWDWSRISARMKMKREYIALYRKVNVGTKVRLVIRKLIVASFQQLRKNNTKNLSYFFLMKILCCTKYDE